MKYSEMLSFSNSDLQGMIYQEKDKLMRMRFAHSISSLGNPMNIRASRKIIARLNTALAIKLKQNYNSNNI
jgi:large subunit ribosomal protein L29